MPIFFKLVIAEKPDVARHYAEFLGCNEKKDGYYFGAGFAVTWCYGHLVNLAMPEAYGYSPQWNRGQLPILPDSFKLIPADNAGAKKQIKIIKDLINDSSEIIVGTDAEREGELIFRYLYTYIGIRKPLNRLWVSSLTPESLRKAFNSLKPGSDYDNLYYCAKSRSEADWLVGLNATQLMTVTAEGKGLLSLGRVQTPTLAMVCARYLENENFKPAAFYEIYITLEKQFQFKLKYTERLDKKENAQSIFSSISTQQTATISKVEKQEKTEKPPHLYDLTGLEQEANKIFGYTADETDMYAQSLYENKKITYPRTDSNFIDEEVYNTVPGLLAKLKGYNSAMGGLISLISVPSRNSVNADKVTDHHAIIPTEIIPTSFKNEKEKNIYDLIVVRTLEAFSNNCIKDTVVVETTINGHLFKASGFTIKVPGWRAVTEAFKKPVDDEHEEKEEIVKFPPLIIGETVKKIGQEIKEGKTTPPPIYTDATLLGAMANCGKKIEDKALKETLKEKGIGTKGTRANILKTLVTRQYIVRKGKKILPTDRGLNLYHLVKDMTLSSVEFTAEWEFKLEEIREGKLDYKLFMSEVNSYVNHLCREVDEHAQKIKAANLSIGGTSLKCPKCGNGKVVFGERAAGCSLWNQGCDFKIWKEVAGKKLSPSDIQNLITKGKTSLIKGFKGKERSFEAVLILMPDYTLKFDFPKAKGPKGFKKSSKPTQK